MSEEQRVATYMSFADIWGVPIVCGLLSGIVTMASIMYWLVEKLGPARGGPAGMAIASATSLIVILVCRLVGHLAASHERPRCLTSENDPS